MHGYFENGNIYTEVEIFGTFKQGKKTFKALIDTGFSGYFTLPYSEAFPLGLILSGTRAYTIADGSTMYHFVCLGKALAEGKEITIPIDIQPKGNILIGMQFLKSIEKNILIDFKNQSIKFQT